MTHKNIFLTLLCGGLIATLFLYFSTPNHKQTLHLSSSSSFLLKPGPYGWDVIKDSHKTPLLAVKHQLKDSISMEYYNIIHDSNVQLHNLEYRYASLLVLEEALRRQWTEDELSQWLATYSADYLIPWIVDAHHHHDKNFQPSSTNEYQWLAMIERTLFDKQLLHTEKVQNMLQ